MQTLRDSLGDFAVSPLHHGDNDDSEPHYHVIYRHGNPCSLEYAKGCIPSGIAANGYVEPCKFPTNAQRYLIHLDQPEKEQFEEGQNAITVINGFPLDLSRELTKAERVEIRERCFDWIQQNDITEYCEFLESLRLNGNPDMFDFAFNHTIAFNAFLKSKRHSSASDDNY